MPWFHNCSHMPDGWCLDCVAEDYKLISELQEKLEASQKANAALRKRLESYQKESSRRYREQQDYLPYEDDPYDR